LSVAVTMTLVLATVVNCIIVSITGVGGVFTLIIIFISYRATPLQRGLSLHCPLHQVWELVQESQAKGDHLWALYLLRILRDARAVGHGGGSVEREGGYRKGLYGGRGRCRHERPTSLRLNPWDRIAIAWGSLVCAPEV
jgi:hypothetical protein